MLNMVENTAEEWRKSAICSDSAIRNPAVHDYYRDMSLLGLPDEVGPYFGFNDDQGLEL